MVLQKFGGSSSRRHKRSSILAGLLDLRGSTAVRTLVVTPGEVDVMGTGVASFQGSMGMLSQLRGQSDWSGQYLFRAPYDGRADFRGSAAVSAPVGPSVYQGQADFQGIMALSRLYLGTLDLQSTRCVVTAAAPTTAYKNGFVWRAEIVVPASSILTAGTTPFTMYVSELQDQFKSAVNGGLLQLPGGAFDVQVELGDGQAAGVTPTVLPRTVVYHDASTGDFCCALRHSGLVAGQNNIVYLYAGKASFTEPVSTDPAWAKNTYLDFLFAINPITGKDLSPNGRDFFASASVVSNFVRVATTTTFQRTGANLVKPTGLVNGTNILTAVDNRSYDFRDIKLTSNLQGVDPPIDIRNGIDNRFSGLSILGTMSRTLTWDSMHADYRWSGLFNRGDDSGGTVTTFENFRVENVEDGYRPYGGQPPWVPFDYFTVRGGYMKYIRDDAVENETVRTINGVNKNTSGLIEDCLFDGVFTFYASRPGLAPDTRAALTVRNVLCRLEAMPIGPIDNDHPESWVFINGIKCACGQLFKLDPDRVNVTMSDSIFVYPSISEAGIHGMGVPGMSQADYSQGFNNGGTYSNVVLVWLGGGAWPGGTLPAGITLYDDTQVAGRKAADGLALFNSERAKWLTAHGCLDGNGDDFSYLHAAAVTTGTFPAADRLRGMPAGDFDGANHQLDRNPWPGFAGWNAFTSSLWVRADADAVGTNRGIVCHGQFDGQGSDQTFAQYWRTTTTDGLVDNPIFGNIGTAADAGFTISDELEQDANAMLLALRWRNVTPNEPPDQWKDGVKLPVATGTARTATAGGPMIAKTVGTIKMGYGPSRTGFQCLRWKGRMGIWHGRASYVADAVLKMEYNNQIDYRSFYGFGGWDKFGDVNHAPIAVPALPFDVAQAPATTPVPVLATDLDPDGDGLTLLSVSQPPTGRGFTTLGAGANLNKVMYSPAAGIAGKVSFDYVVKDSSGKTSSGRATVNVTSQSIPLELPPAQRSIWGGTPGTVGLSESQLRAVLAATGAFPAGIQVRHENGDTGTLAGPVKTDDYLMLEPGNFDNDANVANVDSYVKGDYTVEANGIVIAPRGIAFNGTPNGPAAVMPQGTIPAITISPTALGGTQRANGKVNSNAVWMMSGQNNILYGVCLTGIRSKCFLSGIDNMLLRCEITGWKQGSAVSPSKTSGGTAFTTNVFSNGAAGGKIWYCTIHDPCPYGRGTKYYLTAGPGLYVWPTADVVVPGDETGNANAKDRSTWKNETLRMGIRHRNQNVNGLMGGLHVKRCMFKNFPPKPWPKNYNSGQDDAIETGGDVSSANTGLTCTSVGGTPTGAVINITHWDDTNTLIEDCVIADHQESGAWPEDAFAKNPADGTVWPIADAAIVDIKAPGTTVRRVRFVRCISTARLDLRGSPFHVIEDIELEGGMSMSVRGYGSTISRVRCGGFFEICSGDINGGTGGADLKAATGQAAEHVLAEDITCSSCKIGTGAVPAKVNDVTINRCSQTPFIRAATVNVDTVTITTGTVALPRNVPNEADVGCTTPWKG